MSCRKTVNLFAFNYLLPVQKFITASYADQHKTTDGSAQAQRISNYNRSAHEKCGLGKQENTHAGCSKWHPSKAAGSSATEAYPCGTLQGDERLRTMPGDIFSILLGASI